MIIDEQHFWSADMVNNFARRASEAHAAGREAIVRRVARSYLPRMLRWMADRPRLLRIAYALRPSWRPEIYAGTDGDWTVFSARTKDGDFVVIEATNAGRAEALPSPAMKATTDDSNSTP